MTGLFYLFNKDKVCLTIDSLAVNDDKRPLKKD